MKKASFLLFLGIIVLVLIGAYTGYVFWQKSTSTTELKKVEKSVTEYQNQVLQKESEQITKAIAAKQMTNSLKLTSIKWSDVIKKIRATIPKENGVPLVQVQSYSGAQDSAISMNVKTLPDREKPYFDVADLIKSFDESDLFADAFVPSISSGTNDKGKEILTFLLSAKYAEKKADDELEAALSDVLSESLDESVPVSR